MVERVFVDDTAVKKKKTGGHDDEFSCDDSAVGSEDESDAVSDSCPSDSDDAAVDDTAAAAAAAADDDTLRSRRSEVFREGYTKMFGEKNRRLFVAVRQCSRQTEPVKAKKQAADALCLVNQLLVKSHVGGVVGAIADAGAALRREVKSRVFLIMSWARTSDFSSRFKWEQIKPGKPHPWRCFAQKDKDEDGKPVKCATFKYAEVFIKKLHQELTGSKTFDGVHAVNLHSVFTDKKEKRDDGGFLKAPDAWVKRARATRFLTLGTFLGKKPPGGFEHVKRLVAEMTELARVGAAAGTGADDDDEPEELERDAAAGADDDDEPEELERERAPAGAGAGASAGAGPDADADDYGIGISVGKVAIDITRETYEDEGYTYEMWPDPLIESLGVDPPLTRYDGSKHADGQFSYGIAQISNGARMKLVVCVPALGDAISGPLSRYNGCAAFCVVTLWAILNVLILALTDREFIPLNDSGRNPFLVETPVTVDDLDTAVKKMKGYGYAKELAARRKAAAKKGVETKGPARRKAAAKKGNETRGPAGREAAAKKAVETKGPAGRTAATKKGNETRGPAGREAAAKKGHATKGPAGRTAAAKKAVETRYGANPTRLKYVCFNKARKNYFFRYNNVGLYLGGKSPIQGAGFKSQLVAAVALNTRLVEEGIVPQNKGWFMDAKERKKKWLQSWSDAMTRADAAAEASTLAAAVDDDQTETAAGAGAVSAGAVSGGAAAVSAEKVARDHAAAQDALAEPEARVRAECGEAMRAALAAAERNLRDKLELQELNLRKRFDEQLAETLAAAAAEKDAALASARAAFEAEKADALAQAASAHAQALHAALAKAKAEAERKNALFWQLRDVQGELERLESERAAT